ncbi:MAG: hypothetical protein M1837_004529 [Sclerophora amabilis]|nr:MAG: hypothetical protein M1837_004529 [Sclerophora amabilis]
MNMLFTWNTENLCIIFEGWRVTGLFSLIWSLLAVMALTAGYEFVREMSRRYEAKCAEEGAAAPIGDTEESSSLLWAGRNAKAAEKKQKLGKAALYAVQVFYSFFIM